MLSVDAKHIKNSTVEGLLEFLVSISTNSVTDPQSKGLTALDLALKVYFIL